MKFYPKIILLHVIHQLIHLKKLLLSGFVFFICASAGAQKPLSLLLLQTDSAEVTGNISLEYKKNFLYETEREKEMNSFVLSLYGQGYLSASVDSVKKDSLNLTAFFVSGKKYEWARISKGNVDEALLNQIGFRSKLFEGKAVKADEIPRLLEKILIHCENSGYPFASVKLDSIEIDQEKVSVSLDLKKSRRFFIDSIIVTGNAKISDRYLQNYIYIKPGDLYNEQLVKRIPARISELPFLKEKQAPLMVFTETQSKLFLYVDEKKASTINGILGILPDAYNSGKTQIIGDARLKLLNPMGKGELLDVNWRKMQSLTNDLKVIFNFPFLFNTPFGADLNLKLYKRDTTFIDINQSYGLQYILQGGNNFKAFVGRQQSSLISTKGYENISVLPNYADVGVTSYGLGFKAGKLDYRLNPRKGFSVQFEGSAGNKHIRKNPKINPVVYDSLALKTVQYKTAFDFDGYIPVFKRSTINLGLQGACLFNSTLFQNELFRFGGFHTLRGFDEESLNASLYSVFTMEYRFFLEQNSYFHIFFDGAYYENQSVFFAGDRYDTPFGFGTGLSFSTRAGIFSLDYALGKQFDNPILIKTGKVHFGFINYF